MEFAYTPFIWPLLLAAFTAAGAALYAWPRRDWPGARALMGLLWALMLWSMAYALEVVGVDFSTKLFWKQAKYIGIAVIPPMWFTFTAQHFGQRNPMKNYFKGLLALIPLLSIGMVYTNDFHHFFWREMELISLGGLTILTTENNWWFDLHTLYSYALLWAGAVIILRHINRLSGVYRRQAITLVVVVLIPWLFNVLFLAGLLPDIHIDPTPFAFTISILLLTWGLVCLQLADLVPVARDTIFDEMADALIVLDSQDMILDVNPAAERLTSRSAAQLLGLPAHEAFAHKSAWLGRYKGQNHAYDEVGTGQGEDQRWYGVQISPFLDRRHRFMGRVMAIRDITARRKAELALYRSNLELDQRVSERTAELAASEEKFRLMAENANDIIWTTDMTLKLNYLSPSTERLTGYTLAEFQNLSPEAMLTPDTLAQVLAAFKEEMGSYKPEPNPAQARKIDLEFLRKDGGVLVLETQFSFLRDAQRQPIGILAVSRDSTERRAAETQKARWNEELERRVVVRTAELEATNQELQALSSTIAHDLRSPLRAVVGYSQIAREQLILPNRERPPCPDILDLLQRIHTEGLRMGYMVDSFLDYLRLRHYPLSVQTVDMHALVNRLIGQIKKKQGDRQISYLIGDLPPALADQTLLSVVWLELLSNAVKFTQHSEDACIEIGAAVQDGKTCYFVHDNGIGFNMEHSDQLFGVFQRLHHPDEFEGTGIGLAKVLRVVSRLGGRIWAEAEPDQGATFFFTLG